MSLRVVSITHSSEVAQARRAMNSMTGDLGFSEEESGRAALVATEICTNMLKHAQSGEFMWRPIEQGERCGVEVLGLDQGPGMHDVARCMQDGFSTGGSPGTGLGAIRRMSQAFDLYSQPDKGTVVMARLFAGTARLPPPALDIGAIVVPKAGEEACGDAWCHVSDARGVRLAGIDGLGHGHHAAAAAAEACRSFSATLDLTPAQALQRMHELLRPTRGAAVALTQIDWSLAQARVASIGNVAVVIATDAAMRRVMSDNGIVGHTAARIRELSYPCPAEATLIVHSDGLSASWQLDRYPGLLQRASSVIAGVLYRDWTRRRDDAMIVVVKQALS